MLRTTAAKRSTGRTLARACAVVLVAVALVAGSQQSAGADTVPPAGTPATVSADALPTWQLNGVVWSQVVINNIVYATGSFTKARPPGVAVGGPGEVAANNIFAYDIRTGNRVGTFNHSLNAQGRVVTASATGSRVYVGGDFTTVDGVVRGHVASFDTVSGKLDTAFHPSVNGAVRAMSATPTALYFGGSFSSVNAASRIRLAAVNPATGSLLPWEPKADNGIVWTMVVAPDKSRVIVGGAFTTLNGQAAYGMGSLSVANGSNLPWAANKTIRDATSTGAITSLRTDGRQIYGSGFAFGAGSSFEGTFAANPTTGAITVLNDCHGDTYDVYPGGAVLYSVSHVHDCSAVGGFPDVNPRNLTQRTLAQTIAATRKNTGPDSYGWNYSGLPASTILHWFPNLTPGTYTGQSQAAWSIAGNGSYIVLGGEFPTVNGMAAQGLIRFAVTALAPDKAGPTYTRKTSPSPVPATSAASPSPGKVTVTYGTAWDYDNESLTYELVRDNATVVTSATVKTTFWNLPIRSFTDTVPAGTTHTYQVRIKDPFGNTLLSPKSSAVTA